MNLLKKLAITGTIITSLLTPNFVRSQEKINPFIQPNDSTTVYYGSGDANSDGKIDQQDYYLMLSGISNDMADVDGDGTPSTQDDLIILKDHLDFGTYLPSDWNYLQKDKKQDWFEKMIAIDKTDTLKYILNEWDCTEFSIQTSINFLGFNNNLPSKYDTTKIQRFNLPLYQTYVRNKTLHGFNAILIGNNPLNWDDWYFIEPQNDKKVKIGDWNLDKNSEVEIGEIYRLSPSGGGYHSRDFIKFAIIDSVPSLAWYDTGKVVLENPVTSISPEKPIIAKDFLLKQNYPNPFNSSTTIDYEMLKPGKVKLEVYNILGQRLETLIDDMQGAGKHKIKWDASKYASGVYFYRLQTSDAVKTKKMIFVK